MRLQYLGLYDCYQNNTYKIFLIIRIRLPNGVIDNANGCSITMHCLLCKEFSNSNLHIYRMHAV
jgi:hypothetical protein